MKKNPPRGAAGAAPGDRRAAVKRRALLAGALALTLVAAAVPSLDTRDGADRDAERVALLQRLDRALRRHHVATGEVPAHVPDPLAGGWETSGDGHFLAALVAAGQLEAELLDPRNDERFQLLYHRYPEGTEGSPEPFYVLALTAFESDERPPPRPAVRGDRDWSHEYPLALVGP